MAKKNCIFILLEGKDLNYFGFWSLKIYTASQILLSAKYLEI